MGEILFSIRLLDSFVEWQLEVITQNNNFDLTFQNHTCVEATATPNENGTADSVWLE